MANYEVKLMINYDGSIQYNKPQNKLSYVGGHTKILYVNRNISFSDMLDKLLKICRKDVREFKYQFPDKDDIILITVHEKDDLENMMREYDKLYDDSNTNPVMRLFIAPLSESSSFSSMGWTTSSSSPSTFSSFSPMGRTISSSQIQ